MRKPDVALVCASHVCYTFFAHLHVLSTLSLHAPYSFFARNLLALVRDVDEVLDEGDALLMLLGEE